MKININVAEEMQIVAGIQEISWGYHLWYKGKLLGTLLDK